MEGSASFYSEGSCGVCEPAASRGTPLSTLRELVRWRSTSQLRDYWDIGFISCRLFLYENIPQLRYHNPNVKFSFEAHQEPESKISFTLGKSKGHLLSFTTTNP